MTGLVATLREVRDLLTEIRDLLAESEQRACQGSEQAMDARAIGAAVRDELVRHRSQSVDGLSKGRSVVSHGVSKSSVAPTHLSGSAASAPASTRDAPEGRRGGVPTSPAAPSQERS